MDSELGSKNEKFVEMIYLDNGVVLRHHAEDFYFTADERMHPTNTN